MKNLIFILGLFFALISCEKAEKLEGEEYLIFGTYNGYCQSNCTSLFKIEEGKLYADDMNTFIPGEELKFKSETLSQEKYDVAYKAFDELPEELMETMDKSFGCPGCVDQDIIYLEYFDGADVHEWQVDTDKDSLPEYLGKYVDTVVEIVEELQR